MEHERLLSPDANNGGDTSPEPLETFRREIAEVRERELAKGTVHLKDVNPEDLIDDDWRIWELVKSEAVTKEDVEKYRRRIYLPDQSGLLPDVSPSRDLFYQFIANHAQWPIAKRDLDERRRAKEKQ